MKISSFFLLAGVSGGMSFAQFSLSGFRRNSSSTRFFVFCVSLPYATAAMIMWPRSFQAYDKELERSASTAAPVMTRRYVFICFGAFNHQRRIGRQWNDFTSKLMKNLLTVKE